MDAGLDKFFGLWDDSKANNEVSFGETAGDVVRKETWKNNVPKPSRFVGFFNPQPEPSNRQSEASAPPSLPPGLSQDSSNEDKEGFQRILQMLGGANPSSGTTTSQINASQQPKPPDAKDQQSRLSMSDHPPSSGRGSEQQATTQNDNLAESRKFTGLESFWARNRREGPPQNRDSGFCSAHATVEGQYSVWSSQQRPQRTLPGNAPGLLPFPELMSRPQDFEAEEAEWSVVRFV
jgi:hypothetical protein